MVSDGTIVAISTPPGTGGIAVIRISGKDSLTIAERIFKGKSSPNSIESHRVIYGRIIDPGTGEEIDDVLLIVMHAPKTYTGEDTVEISCHGGIVPAQRTLEACISAGARMAQRGEFTKRAFLNGRLDLTQAEAVLDIVTAKTKEGLRGALYQLNGLLSKKIRRLKDFLISILSDIELSLDFVDEDITVPEQRKISEKISSTIDIINELIKEGKRACILRDGVSAAIVGRPNVGKSSLLNALLLEERAIVTPVPGTTRDVIEGWINVKGIPLKLYDTCGFQDAENIVEEIGIEKTKETIENTSFLLFVADGSVALEGEDKEIFNRAKDKPLIIVINKIDLPKRINISDITNGTPHPICEVSAKEHTGIEQLNKKILKLIGATELKIDEVMPTRTRHLVLLSKAEENLTRAIRGIEEHRSPELIAFDIKEASRSLGEIIGEVTPEEILDKIFQEFCIGK